MALISNFGISFCIKASDQHLQPFYDFYFKRKPLKKLGGFYFFQKACFVLKIYIKSLKMRENKK